MNINKETNSRKGLKDVWNAYMCQGATFSNCDIPMCPTIMTDYPKDVILWDDAKRNHEKYKRKDKSYFKDAYICFYSDDYKFDGVRTSVWSYPWLAFRVLKHYRGIITPDFSTYQDFPYPLKIWNTFRMRAFGLWAGRQGLEVINNVRWGTPETYQYCFDGIEKNSVVAIGTVGGSPRKLEDRKRFEEGLEEMMRRLSPKGIVIYGSSNYPCFDKLRSEGVDIMSYKSSTARYYEGRSQDE